MTDSILDEVEDLLEKELGDKQILEQIKRAAENNEVISNFERNYVRKLTEKHLGQKPTVAKTIDIQQKISPDVEISSPPLSVKPQVSQILAPRPKITKLRSKNNIILIGIGIAVLAIIIIVSLSLSETSDRNPTSNEPTQTSSTSKSFLINLDSASYKKGDIISINGKSDLSIGNQVSLAIVNPNGELVWSQQVSVKNDGQFNTLTFAGGFGWEKTGTFIIEAEGGSEIATRSFSFK